MQPLVEATYHLTSGCRTDCIISWPKGLVSQVSGFLGVPQGFWGFLATRDLHSHSFGNLSISQGAVKYIDYEMQDVFSERMQTQIAPLLFQVA